jgi:hypothetical protein
VDASELVSEATLVSSDELSSELVSDSKTCEKFQFAARFFKSIFLFTTKVLSDEIFLNWNRFIH